MISINEYINQIYVDFKEENDRGKRLCHLKELTFEGGSLPDYTDIQIQRLYLLRYAFAYAYEYTNMYLEVLEKMGNPINISVASIGCGTMLDYWSLVQAIYKKGLNCSIKYTGIDEISWNYKILKRDMDNVSLGIGNAKGFFENNKFFCSDVYFFPKSISEFSEDEMDSICDSFGKKPILKDTIYLCISLRSSDVSIGSDINRTKAIVDALERNGFKSDCKYNSYTSFDKSVGIKAYDNDYLYPNEARDYVLHLNEKCANYTSNGNNCYDNCLNLNRYPVMKTGMICYQIIKFERTN